MGGKIEKIKLDLGCGNNKKNGFIGIDLKGTDADIYADFKESLPIKNSVVDEVHSHGVLEHIPYLHNKDEHGVVHVMKEIYRVCKDDARVEITVPYWTSKNLWKNPTHYRGFHERSMDFFCGKDRSYFSDINFELLDVEFTTYGYKKLIPFKGLLSKLGLNVRDDVTFHLKVIK